MIISGQVIGKVLGFLVGLKFGAYGPFAGLVLGHFLLDRSGIAQSIVRSIRDLLPKSQTVRYPPCPSCRRPMVPVGAAVYACPACCATPMGPLAQIGTRSATVQAALMGTLVAVAKCDGPLHGAEVRAIRDFHRHELGLIDSDLARIKDLLKATSDSRPNAKISALALSQFLDPDQKKRVLSMCRTLALADGPIGPVEQRVLDIVAGAFQCRVYEADPEVQVESQDPYEVLGLTRSNADENAIRSAHRKLAIQYHPDRVTHLAPEFRALAERKFKAIQRARDELLG